MPKLKARNVRGFKCVNILMQKVIGKLTTAAKNRDRERARTRANPEQNRAKALQWKLDNPEQKKKTDAAWYAKNSERRKVEMKQYGKDNHDELLEKSNTRQRERRSYDAGFRISGRLRARLQQFLSKSAPKSGHTYDMIQCTQEELVHHLEDKSGLKIEGNEVDHIFPMSGYNFEDGSQQFQAMHFSNLQLLTCDENRNKSNKLPTKAMAAKVDRSCWPDGITEDMLPNIYPGWATPLRM
jgi:hypothetical protein